MSNRSDLEEFQVYLEKKWENQMPDAEEEIELIKRVRDGDEDAKKKLCEAYLGLVVLIAKRYAVTEAKFPDLFQEGTIGLMEAIKKYDYTKGHFKTYVTCVIKLYIDNMLYVEKRKTHFEDKY